MRLSGQKFLAFFAIIWSLASFAFAQEEETLAPNIIYESSDSEVPLNITFNGKEILIYGAVQNLDDEDPDMIIRVRGPRATYTIYEKVRKFGLWVNGPNLTFRNAPSYLGIFSDAPLDDIILPTEKQRYEVGFEQALPIRGLSLGIVNPQQFVSAFVALQNKRQTYILDEDGVRFKGQVLFTSRIPLAADIVEGQYDIEIMLLNRGRVVASLETELPVYKSGLERWLYDLAMERGFLYGLLAIFLAIFSAFFMAQFMRLFRR